MLQSVLGMEIDAFNRVWLLDQGRVNGSAAIAGSIKLVVWNLLLQQLELSYVFPPEVANPATAFVNDLVLDQPRGIAYISDTGIPVSGVQTDFNPGLIVFDFNQKRSWRMLSAHRTTQPDFTFRFQVAGRDALPEAPMMAGVDGIALSPDGLFLFYTPLTSRELYSVPTNGYCRTTRT